LFALKHSLSAPRNGFNCRDVLECNDGLNGTRSRGLIYRRRKGYLLFKMIFA